MSKKRPIPRKSIYAIPFIFLALVVIVTIVNPAKDSSDTKTNEIISQGITKEEFMKECLEDKEVERIKCVALATDDVSLCNTLRVGGELSAKQRENCRFRYFLTQAIIKNNVSYCKNLGNVWGDCLLTVTRNASVCRLAKDPEISEKCTQFITQPIITLEDKTAVSLDENSLNYYTNIALREKKPELCDLWPIYRKARKCKVVADPELKTEEYCNKDVEDECEDMYHYELAQLSNSDEECSKIKFVHKRNECFSRIA